ncbi:MAG: S8 family serine peptidase [Blastocatellia bacterium]
MGLQHKCRQGMTFALAALLALPSFGFASIPGVQTLRDRKGQDQTLQKPKLAPDLEELLALDDKKAGDREKTGRIGARTLADKRGKKIRRETINRVVIPSAAVGAEERQSFIVQMSDTASMASLPAKLALAGGTVRQAHNGMGLVTIEAPRNAIRQLAAQGIVAYVSPDRPIAAQGHVETTTGAKQIRGLISGKTLKGTNIGVAVIDSGVDDWHNRTYFNNPGVVYQKDFTSNNNYRDSFGHGTHVAGLVAGTDTRWTGHYEGLAEGAKIINLRVLNQLGVGTASSVIAALDWCIANKATHNLRVINLSLGTRAKDSYKTDPLCLAARRAVNAGIVVVAAAGNEGKNLLGSKVYGGIHSPGIEPSVITVGASNTYGTDARGDDTVATFSSRGPTRGYATVNGVKKYDNLIKPDLIAPGNKLISAAAGYYGGNLLLSLFPSLLAEDDGAVDERMMYLSGTSMAAPLVAGTVAMMLEVNPNLTPNLVRAILMYTAQPLKNFNMLEQGAGQLNVDGAVRLAKLVKSTMPSTVGGALLSASLPTQSSTIAGTAFKWGQGVITNHGFLSGNGLMQYWQAVYANGVILGDATTIANGVFSLVSGKTSSGITLKSGALTVNGTGVILGDAANTTFASGVMLGDGVIIGDGVMLGDGVIIGDGAVLGDGVIIGDYTMLAQSSGAVQGDNTGAMTPLGTTKSSALKK